MTADMIKIYWQEILITFGGATILLFICGWLVRSLILHFLSKDVEVYKAKIKTAADREIESYKNTLRMSNFEHEVRFSRMHEERAKVIAEIYTRLSVALEVASEFLQRGIASGQEERANECERALKNFKDCFYAHRIYLEEPVCEQLDDFYKNTINPTLHFDIVAMTSDPNDKKTLFEARRDAMKDLQDKAVPIRKALEREFRNILGVAEKADE